MGKLLANPEHGLTMARHNLRKLQRAHPRGRAAHVLGEWEQLLDGPVEAVAEVLTSKDQRSVELRQSSPFAGLLSERERTAVLTAFGQESIFS